MPVRIAEEPNIEVRRCERLGWDVYIERAGLRLVAAVVTG
ncbi:hypothetical protein GCM10010404_64140 [Nonomuraea africana]|uniref:Uncharacterized protein n=1 Tax=Nonomuraea africana TaxID=46171 RepID=A0ABR9KGT1_9ACTN|nr:hypothetical protein [Nonomuraea africana]